MPKPEAEEAMHNTAEYLIKIAIADDHKIFRDGIKMALSGKENLKMLWEAQDGKDLMHKMTIKKPMWQIWQPATWKKCV